MRFGLIGSNGAGKSAACRYFQEKGFQVFSLSDVVREAALAQGLSLDRDHLVAVGNELKQTHGADVLASRCLERAASHPLVVFDSIRNVAEAKMLKAKGVILLGIDAPIEVRFNRIKSRKSETDFIDFETFKAQDERENEGKSSGQNIFAAFQECHHVIHNVGALATLQKEIRKIILSSQEK